MLKALEDLTQAFRFEKSDIESGIQLGGSHGRQGDWLALADELGLKSVDEAAELDIHNHFTMFL